MAKVILFCAEAAGLTLGPSSEPGKNIHFTDGFATFNSADFPGWEEWVKYPGGPRIEVLPPDTEEVPVGTAGAFECPVCAKSLKTEFGYKGHLRSHAPKKG